MHTRFAVAALSVTLFAAPALAQQGSPNTTPGAVTRVILIDIKPGRGDGFWMDMRKNLKPISDEQKRQGMLLDYTVATKVTVDHADDWDVVVTLTYPNWAALDTFGPKSEAITLAHYGSAANRTAANLARLENSTVVGSSLVRNQTVNPWR